MMSTLSIDPSDQDDPLTVGERQRLGALLASVGSRTLLQSLAGMCRMNEDARLIIAELIERLPPDTDKVR